MAVYTKEYESQPEAILTNVIICPAVDLSANVAVPVHCQVENVLWDTDWKNVGQGKSVDIGGRRIIKKKKERKRGKQC